MFAKFASNIKVGTAMLMLMFPASSLFAQAVNDSVDVYQNHTVSSEVSVQGRTLLNVSNVTVLSTGKLKLSGPSGVLITSPFTVDLGGVLEVNGGRQYPIRISYDLSGNIINRKQD